MKNAFRKLMGITFLIFFMSLPITSWRPTALPDSHNTPACSPLNDNPNIETIDKKIS